MVRKIIFLFLSSLVVFITTIYFRVGGHKQVLLSEEQIQEMHFLYLDHQGPYHKINDVIVQVEKVATKNSIPCAKTFGEYLDHPQKIDERYLRSRGGCLLSARLEQTPQGFQQMTVPQGKYLVAKFDGAPSIGPLKVYPKVAEWFQERKIMQPDATLEIYTIHGDQDATTDYYFKIGP